MITRGCCMQSLLRTRMTCCTLSKRVRSPRACWTSCCKVQLLVETCKSPWNTKNAEFRGSISFAWDDDPVQLSTLWRNVWLSAISCRQRIFIQVTRGQWPYRSAVLRAMKFDPLTCMASTTGLSVLEFDEIVQERYIWISMHWRLRPSNDLGGHKQPRKWTQGP